MVAKNPGSRLILTQLLTVNSMTLGKSLTSLGLSFLVGKNGDNNRIYIIELL